MFVVNVTELNVIPGVESVLWKHILLKKICAFDIACGYLIVYVDNSTMCKD